MDRMIKHVIDRRTISGDPQAYAAAVQAGLQDFFKHDAIEVVLVDYEVLHDVLTDYDPVGDRARVVQTIVNSVPKNLDP